MKRLGLLVSIVMVASLLLSCASPTPEIVEKVVTQVVTQVVKETVVQKEVVKETVVIEGTPQIVEKEVTKVVEVEKVVTAPPTPEPEPAVGGTLVIARQAEPPTLDAHLSVSGEDLNYIGATLVTMGPEGDYVPYLAESWEVSEDSLTWDFKLREDVKFHDGTPLTAHDYAWTFQRVLDPETKAAAAGSTFGPLVQLVSAEAADDYTLRLKLAWPSYSLLAALDLPFMQPLSQAAVEQWGDQYGRHPVGVGPYKFKEWVTGEKIVLERNPDYTWGPEFADEGPLYIENIEMRFIPEIATILAGLETGEIDHADVPTKDVQRIRDTGQFQIFEWLLQGMTPGLFPNTSIPPFDDALVRRAFNLAVDREALIKIIVGEGNAVPQYGPISSSVGGYWPGVEYIGYGYNLEKAKALMEEAGYTYNNDGMLEKDGEPFELELVFTPEFPDPNNSRIAEVLQQQWKALGADVKLGQYEWGVLIGLAVSNEMELGLAGYNWWDAGLLALFFRTGSAMNFSHYADPKMDEFLDLMQSTADPQERQEWANETQKHLVEQAVVIPLYTPKVFAVLSNRVMGDVPLLPINRLWLNDLYLESK